MSQKRAAVLVVNPSRAEAVEAATVLAELLHKANFDLFTISEISIDGVTNSAADKLPEVEIAVVLGGDGTILRGAELTRERNIPLLGINIGHVGFMAEVIRPEISAVAKSVIDKSYGLDSRMVRWLNCLNPNWVNGICIQCGWTSSVARSRSVSSIAYFGTCAFC